MAHQELLIELERLRSIDLSHHSQEWIKALEGFLNLFASQAILSGEAFDRVLKYEILDIIERALADLTIEENRKYRTGLSKTAWQALLFILSTDVGHTPVPNQKGHLRILDYRYTESEIIKVGEGQEALDALEVYEKQLVEYEELDDVDISLQEMRDHKDMLDGLAIDALTEISDLFYNWAQLRMGLGEEEKETYDLSQFTSRFNAEDKKQVEDLIVILTSLAVWKFHYRYFELGEKRIDDERAYILLKMKEISLSPRKLLENHWILIQELIDGMLAIAYKRVQLLAKMEKTDTQLFKTISRKIIKPNGFSEH